MTIDIRQVAAHAGVSPATVSRVTNGSTSVNAVLSTRVWKSIRELGYSPNHQARALVSGRSRTLGLLVSELSNPFFAELVESFEAIADQHGYDVMTGSTNHLPERAARFIQRLLQRKVEGIAVMTFRPEALSLESLVRQRMPLVSIDLDPGGSHSAVLKIDYNQGFMQAVQHLAVLGHRRFGMITGLLAHQTNIDRREAYLLALAQIGVKRRPDWIVEGDNTFEGGAQAAERLLAGRSRPTAILCSNDLTAIGALRTLYRHNIRVPDQISVVGFDDIRLAQFTSPSLTTIRMSRTMLAQSAFDFLHAMQTRGDHSATAREILFPVNLVVRESTARPHPSAPALPISTQTSTLGASL